MSETNDDTYQELRGVLEREPTEKDIQGWKACQEMRFVQDMYKLPDGTVDATGVKISSALMVKLIHDIKKENPSSPPTMDYMRFAYSTMSEVGLVCCELAGTSFTPLWNNVHLRHRVDGENLYQHIMLTAGGVEFLNHMKGWLAVHPMQSVALMEYGTRMCMTKIKSLVEYHSTPEHLTETVLSYTFMDLPDPCVYPVPARTFDQPLDSDGPK